MEEEEEEGNGQQVAAAVGKPLSAAERTRNGAGSFEMRFKKLRAHKQQHVLHATVSVYPDGKVLYHGDYALTSVLEQPKLLSTGLLAQALGLAVRKMSTSSGTLWPRRLRTSRTRGRPCRSAGATQSIYNYLPSFRRFWQFCAFITEIFSAV